MILLTRSKFLDAAVMAVSYTMVCLLCYTFSADKSKLLIWTAAILFLAMPKEIWAQAIVWTSGYSNYVPSALISVVFLIVVRKALDHPSEPEKKPGNCIWLLVLGFCGALFVENVTIFNICFASGAIFYLFLKFRKQNPELWSFLVGAILGACAMFSNSAYHNIVIGDDYYRSTPDSIGESIETIVGHVGDILTYLIYDNLVFCGIITILLVILGESWCISQNRKTKSGKVPMIVHFGSFLLISCKDSLLCLMEQQAVLSARMLLLLEIVVALIYVGSILLMILCYVENGRKFGMIMPIFCVAGSAVPLLVVSPIGPHCVFIGYFFMMVFAADLIGYLKARVIPEGNGLGKLACLIVLMQTLTFVNLYYPVYYYDNLRTDFLKKQVEAGKQTIWICDLPNSDYLWNSTPAGKSLPRRYKVYHGLDEHVELEIISREDMKVLYDDYR